MPVKHPVLVPHGQRDFTSCFCPSPGRRTRRGAGSASPTGAVSNRCHLLPEPSRNAPGGTVAPAPSWTFWPCRFVGSTGRCRDMVRRHLSATSCSAAPEGSQRGAVTEQTEAALKSFLS